MPKRLVGDRAYDSDPLDAELAVQGVQMIAPHRSNRKKPKTQDGRVLRRYKRRWKVERLAAQLPPPGDALGAQGTELSRLRAAWLHHYLAPTFMRYLLVMQKKSGILYPPEPARS